jgi:RNA polymerase sigma-70 factor (ECF subfamily)
MVMIHGESLGQRAGALAPLDDPLVLLDAQDDESLLARLRAGDEAAFRALVDRHRPWLVRLCTRLLGQDAHAAEDAAQESLLKLHAAARRDARPLRVRAWLTVVARNTCVDEQRRRRPDLPGELPERAAPGDDPFSLDAALADAWPRLSGRHREVLYLREVLGFSYKEIGSVMGLSMPAVETLVFRARAALRREYERAGGTAFGCGLFGFHLARLGIGRRRDLSVTDGMSSAAVSDPGFGSLASRVAHFLSTSLPGCEQTVAKVLSVAAGVVVAAATVIPGIGPFADTAPAGAAAGAGTAAMAAQAASDVASLTGGSSAATKSASLKSLLGNAVPADWAPQRSRREEKAGTAPAPSGTPNETKDRLTPLRDAAAATRSGDRPTLRGSVRDDADPGPLRSILASQPDKVDRPERPAQPLRSLLADPIPLLLDALPIDPPSSEPGPVEPVPTEPAPTPSPLPAPGSHPIRETVQPAKEAVPPLRDTLTPGGGNVADREPDLLQRRNG